MKVFISKFLTLVFILVFIIYFYFNYEDFHVLTNIGLVDIFLLVFLNVFLIVVNSLIFKLFFLAFSKNISFLESLDLTIVSSVANLFVPMKAGALVRAVYFKNKHGIDYSKFVSIFLGNYIILLLITTLSTLVFLNINPIEKNFSYLILNIIVVVLFMMSFVLIFLKTPKLPKFANKIKVLSKIIGFVERAGEAWQLIIKKKKLLSMLIIFNLINFLITAAIYFVEFRAIGIHLNFLSISLYTSLSVLSFFIGITPASLGIREFILIIFASQLSIGSIDILNISVLDRVVLFAFMFVLFLVFKFTNKLNHDPSKTF